MYNEYQPSLLLAPYIDKYWEFKGNPDYGMKINILPDGCTDFIFTLGEVADIAFITASFVLVDQTFSFCFIDKIGRAHV